MERETIDWKWEMGLLKDSIDFLRSDIHKLIETIDELIKKTES